MNEISPCLHLLNSIGQWQRSGVLSNREDGLKGTALDDFLYCRFRERISERSIGRTLRSIGWTRTTIHRIAQQRDADLRDHYLHRISQYKSYQLGRAGYRRWGWSPKGFSPV